MISDKRIIYPQDNGRVAVVTPFLNIAVDESGQWIPLRPEQEIPEGLRRITVEEIAERDVPAGKPWKIIDFSEIPEDRTYRNAWEYEE